MQTTLHNKATVLTHAQASAIMFAAQHTAKQVQQAQSFAKKLAKVLLQNKIAAVRYFVAKQSALNLCITVKNAQHMQAAMQIAMQQCKTSKLNVTVSNAHNANKTITLKFFANNLQNLQLATVQNAKRKLQSASALHANLQSIVQQAQQQNSSLHVQTAIHAQKTNVRVILTQNLQLSASCNMRKLASIALQIAQQAQCKTVQIAQQYNSIVITASI